jgi:hypothetical protein
MNETLREELLVMAAEDRRVRQQLLETGKLGDGYAPEMEAVHRKNASRLKEMIDEHGWPDRDLVGEDGTLAAWFIAQHAIGDPEFQRQALGLIQQKTKQGRVPDAQEAYLFDRIACTRAVLRGTVLNPYHVPMVNTAGG